MGHCSSHLFFPLWPFSRHKHKSFRKRVQFLSLISNGFIVCCRCDERCDVCSLKYLVVAWREKREHYACIASKKKVLCSVFWCLVVVCSSGSSRNTHMYVYFVHNEWMIDTVATTEYAHRWCRLVFQVLSVHYSLISHVPTPPPAMMSRRHSCIWRHTRKVAIICSGYHSTWF